jgi:guanosine-3',5'-bis(diphosphate) 3'-pyrophosphohydrolase
VEGTLREHGFPEEDLEAIRKGRSQGPFSMERRVEQQMAWLRGLAEDGVARLELDLYPDKIFVLTPGREVIQLKKGSTPVDFAYAVHTELGNKMVHAKVNGRVVPLDYALRNGEVVEIVTRNSAKPSLYWISIAQTNSARSKIKNWFNKQDREGNVQLGRQLLNEQLQLLGKPLLDERLSLLKEYAGKSRDFQEREQLLEALALGSTTVAQLAKMLFPGETLAPAQVAKPKATEGQLTFEVLVTGEEALPVVLSACCKPQPPVSIIGYVARGRSIRIHRQSCSSLGGLEGERFVSAHWKGE